MENKWGRTLVIPEGHVQQVSDGYNTFKDLYKHINTLVMFAANSNPDVCWKSRTDYVGYLDPQNFKLGFNLPTKEVLVYTIPIEYWDVMRVKEYPKGMQSSYASYTYNFYDEAINNLLESLAPKEKYLGEAKNLGGVK